MQAFHTSLLTITLSVQASLQRLFKMPNTCLWNVEQQFIECLLLFDALGRPAYTWLITTHSSSLNTTVK